MPAHLTAHPLVVSPTPSQSQLDDLQLLRQPTHPPTNQGRGSCYRNKEWNHITQKQHEKVRSLSLSQVKGGASAANAVIQLHAKVRGQQLAQLRCSVREQKGKEVEVLVLLDRTGSWLLN